MEPFLVSGKLRSKRGECGLCAQSGAEKAENKVSPTLWVALLSPSYLLFHLGPH